jgi:hypothetical protein
MLHEEIEKETQMHDPDPDPVPIPQILIKRCLPWWKPGRDRWRWTVRWDSLQTLAGGAPTHRQAYEEAQAAAWWMPWPE